MKKLSCVLVGILAITGCSHYSSNGEHVYLKSRNGQRLVVPPPLTAVDMSAFYDLPEQNQKARVRIAPP